MHDFNSNNKHLFFRFINVYNFPHRITAPYAGATVKHVFFFSNKSSSFCKTWPEIVNSVSLCFWMSLVGFRPERLFRDDAE